MRSKMLRDDVEIIKHFGLMKIACQYRRMAVALDEIAEHAFIIGCKHTRQLAEKALKRFEENK